MAVSRGHALGHAQCSLKGGVRQRPGGAGAGRQLVGLLHLAENLRLADDHAVEAGGDGEQVPHEIFARMLEQLVE